MKKKNKVFWTFSFFYFTNGKIKKYFISFIMRYFSTSKSIKEKNKLSIKIGVILLCILFLIFQFFSWFSHVASPKFIHVAKANIEKYITHLTSDFRLLLEKNNSDSFLIIKENQNGEITSILYDMPKIYELAEKFTNTLETKIGDYPELSKYVNKNSKLNQKDGFLLMYPMGMASNSVFLSQLGPKIPVFIEYVGSVFSSVKTRAKDYGINNVLLEVYLEIKITYEILTPVTMEENTFSYELLLDSKVIQGTVPDIYGGYMETRSAFFDISFP